jgi:hypothetical protein
VNAYSITGWGFPRPKKQQKRLQKEDPSLHANFKFLFETDLNFETELNKKWGEHIHSRHNKGSEFSIFIELIKMEAGERDGMIQGKALIRAVLF